MQTVIDHLKAYVGNFFHKPAKATEPQSPLPSSYQEAPRYADQALREYELHYWCAGPGPWH